MRIEVEACIESASDVAVRTSVHNTYVGGAARVELCRAMTTGGLTPSVAHIRIARDAFRDRPGVLVMIRPRAGDFAYGPDELDAMQTQIDDAARAGADGVVLGAVRDGRLDVAATRRLVQTAHRHGLAVTFHRAFDAIGQPGAVLETLIDLGVDRVLTSGTPWEGGGHVLGGLDRLSALVEQAGARIEIVVGGGLRRANVRQVLAALPLMGHRVSVHAFSDLRLGGVTDTALVADLVRRANAHRTDEGAR